MMYNGNTINPETLSRRLRNVFERLTMSPVGDAYNFEFDNELDPELVCTLVNTTAAAELVSAGVSDLREIMSITADALGYMLKGYREDEHYAILVQLEASLRKELAA